MVSRHASDACRNGADLEPPDLPRRHPPRRRRAALAITPVALSRDATRSFETVDPAPSEPTRAVARVDRLVEGSPPFPKTIDELIELGHFEYLGAMRGEYYVGEEKALPTPEELDPHTVFTTFISTAGVAAFREEHTLGMMETDRFRWTIQTTGGGGATRNDLVTGLALLLADRKPDCNPEAAVDEDHHTGGLWDLLPLPGDFPSEVRILEEASTG